MGILSMNLGSKVTRTMGRGLTITDNKAGYTATKVACGWAGAIFEVTRPFGQEQ